MPIQLPASGGTAQGKTDSGSSLTVSFTAKAGVERLLVVSVAGSQAGGANITGATWNGSALTLAGSYTTPDTNNRKHYAFYRFLGDSGSDTTADLVVSGSGADYIGLAAQQYNGVLQTGQPDITTVVEQSTNGAGSKTTTLTTVTDHAWAVVCEGGYNDTGDPEASTGTTFRVAETTYGTCGILDSGGGLSPAGAASFTTARNATAYRISHIVIVFKPGTLAPPIRLYVNDVEEYDGDLGDGAAFRAAVAAVVAAGGGGSVLCELGSASTFELVFASRWTLPANALGDTILLGVKTSVLDGFKPSGSPYIPGTDDMADWLTLRYSGTNTDALIQTALTGHSYHWQGVAFDYGTGTGNVVVATTPQATFTYDSADQDGYEPSEQPDDWQFDRCIEKAHIYTAGSFQAIKHNGKAITLLDHYVERTNSTGGQGDGYAHIGDVGDGPWLIRRAHYDRVGGEVWGFGSHGQRSGAGSVGAGDPGYQAFADADHQPLNAGLVFEQAKVHRNPADRKFFHSVTSNAIGTGSKTFTVPTGQTFVNGEAIYCEGYGGNNMTGTVTSYTAATGSLVLSIASVNGSGTKTDWSIKRSDVTYNSKNMGEFCYGQDVYIQGNDFRYYWHDMGQQYYPLILKLSTEELVSLEHVATRRITIRYNVFRSVSQLLSLARYVATNNNPAISDITFEHNLCFDLGLKQWGFPSTGNLINLGLDMPVNVRIRNNLFDVPVGDPGWISIGDAGSAHYSRNALTGFTLENNIALLSGTHPYYEIFGYFGTTPTAIIDPGHFLETGCTSAVARNNSVVTGPAGQAWRSFAAANTFYAEAAGRTSLLGKLTAPTAAADADRDYRYATGQEELGADGLVRGPNYWAMYQAMGWAWPFSWVPAAPPGGHGGGTAALFQHRRRRGR